jgi:hypothetical protein
MQLTCVGNVRLEAGLRRALGSVPQLSLKDGMLPTSSPADALISVPGVGSIGFVLIVPPHLASRTSRLAGGGRGTPATHAPSAPAAETDTLSERLLKLATVHKYACVILPSDMHGVAASIPAQSSLCVYSLPAALLSSGTAYASAMVGITLALSNALSHPTTPAAEQTEEEETANQIGAVAPCVAELLQEAGGGEGLTADDAVALLDMCGGSLFDLATLHPRTLQESGWAQAEGWVREMHERP